MVKDSELVKDIYRPKDVARMLGVTVKTLYNRESAGSLSFKRDKQTDRRYLDKADLVRLLDEHGLYFDDSASKKRDVIYARVSSHDQKSNGDLDRQIALLTKHAKDANNLLVLSEVGSGLNDKRPKLQRLLRMIMNDEVSRIFITFSDRLTRFGYRYFETICSLKGVEIVEVRKAEQGLMTIQEEMVKDIMSLMASFSGKFYGLRSARNRKNKAS